MNRSRALIALIVAGALLFSAVTVATAQALAGKGRPTATAVIDVEKVLNSLNEFQQFQADINSLREKVNTEEADKKKELNNLQDELKLMASQQPGYKEKVDALRQKAFEFQAWGQWQQNELIRERNLRILGLYRKVTEAAGEYAKANGIDVVLLKEASIEQIAKLKPEEMEIGLSNRKLIYYTGELEITDPVITSMNNAYKNLKH